MPVQIRRAVDRGDVLAAYVVLKAAGCTTYWCHHPVCLGIRVAASAKVLTCAQEDDVCVLYASGKGRDMARDATRTYLARTLAHGLVPRVFLCIDANRRAR